MSFNMPSTERPSSLVWPLMLCCISLVFLKALHNRYFTGLNAYPGPALAPFTNLWRAVYLYLNRHAPPLISLHDQYGDVVRLGPRCLSFADPAAISSFNKMVKSEWYPVNAMAGGGHYLYTLFSGVDERWHSQLRKSVNWIFTPQAVASYETLLDQTLLLFLRELESRFARKDVSFDLSEWFLYFTSDFIGDLTYNRRYGFLREGKDVNGMNRSIDQILSYGFFFGQVPSLDRLFRHNVIYMWLERRGIALRSVVAGVDFTKARLQERREYDARHDGKSEKKPFRKGVNAEDAEANHEDLLDRFNRAKVDHPETVTDREVQSLCLTMFLAGAETTAITLSGLLYNLLRHPRCYRELQKELDGHLPSETQVEDDEGSDAVSRTVRRTCFSNTHKLPYLNACIQETFRVHSAFATILERVTPPGGTTICGHFVPGGTIVGANPWVVHHNREVFGEDVDVYRPERWLVDDSERVKRMDRALYQFGGGSRLCIGRHIAYLEMYKVVPSLFVMYEMELEDPAKELDMTNGVFMRISDLKVRIRPRQQT